MLQQHGFMQNGDVVLTFTDGTTQTLDASQLFEIARQLQQFSAKQRDTKSEGWASKLDIRPLRHIHVSTTDTHTVALIADPETPAETVFSIEPELALQLSDLLREQALFALRAPRPLKN